MSGLKVEALQRELFYNGTRIPDPAPNLSVEQVRELLTPTWPEIATATLSGPEDTGSALRYTFIHCSGCGFLKIGPALRALEAEEKGLGAAFYWTLIRSLYRVMRIYDHSDAQAYEENLIEYAQEDDPANRDQYEFPEVEKALNDQTKGLILLTATPMQVTPLEVWDLLSLLGLPLEWDQNAFLRFFEDVVSPNPATATLDSLAYLFRAVEQAYGEVPLDEVLRFCSGSAIRAKRILRALREHSSVPRAQLGTEDRKVALRLMRANTPIRKLISRHTRDLLRKYFKEGKISTPIADRDVRDIFVSLTPQERKLYEEVEDYIERCYNAADQQDRTAVGFVMTIYRRRLASSFYALRQTLDAHLASIREGHAERTETSLDDDTYDDELDDELLDSAEAAKLEKDALVAEEVTTIESIVREAGALPPDSKVRQSLHTLSELSAEGYSRIMVFTQYTDTMDFLREHLSKETQYVAMEAAVQGARHLHVLLSHFRYQSAAAATHKPHRRGVRRYRGIPSLAIHCYPRRRRRL